MEGRQQSQPSLVDGRPQEAGASRATVRQALHELAAEGAVERIQGKGTFVLPPKVTLQLELTSHTDAMQRSHLRPGSRVISIERMRATTEIAEGLAVRQHTEVVRIERLRLANDDPMALETVHLEADRVPGIEDHLTDRASLYATLWTVFGIELAGADQTIETAMASPQEAKAFCVDSGTPMMMLTRRSWDIDDRAVEFTTSLYRGDRYRFTTRLAPPGRSGRGSGES